LRTKQGLRKNSLLQLLPLPRWLKACRLPACATSGPLPASACWLLLSTYPAAAAAARWSAAAGGEITLKP